MATADCIPPLPEGCLPIAGFPAYCVRDDGTVFSCRVYGSRLRRLGPWWAMKPKKKPRVRWLGGYLYVDLFREVGKPERHFVHHLVLSAFVAPRPEGQEGRHLDDDRLNNRLENLAWGTRRENQSDARRNGRTSRGESRYNAYLTDAQISEARRMRKAGALLKEICRFLGVTKQHASRICRGEIWKHVT